jgi:peptidyl-prolyl cis-trans isomerase C
MRRITERATAWRSRTALVGALLAGVSIGSVASAPQTTPDGGTVAAVGSRTIVVADLRDELVARRRRDMAINRLDAFTSAGRDQALNDVIDEKVFASAARDERLDQQPDVARRLGNVVDRFLAEAKVREIVAQTPSGDEALRAYYAAHTELFRGPEQIRARHIVVATRAEAERVLTHLREGADFAAVARGTNIDATKASGGDLGLVKKGAMVQPFDQALFALRAGGVSDVVQTSSGFHIIKAEAVVVGTLPEFAAIRDLVRQKAIEQRVADVREQLGHRYPVTIDKEMLAKVIQ